MNIKEQFRAEIERLKSLHSPIPFCDNYEVGYSDGYQDCCDSILAFLDTLPEQVNGPSRDQVGTKFAVEGLEDEMDKYYDSPEWEGETVSWMTFTRIARHFAEWGAEHLKK